MSEYESHGNDPNINDASVYEAFRDGERALKDFVIRSKATLLPNPGSAREPKWTTTTYETTKKPFKYKQPPPEEDDDDVQTITPPTPVSCPPVGAPAHISVSLIYALTATSCDDAFNVDVEASATFTDVAADLVWTGTEPIFGTPVVGSCFSQLITSSLPMDFTCPSPCVFNTVTATFDLYLTFDGTNYGIYVYDVFHDETAQGICGDGGAHDLPQFPDSNLTNIGPSPLGTHTIHYDGSPIGFLDSADFTIVIS